MKTTLKFVVILFAMLMQVSTICADDTFGTHVFMVGIDDFPEIGGIAGPRRAPVRPHVLSIDVYFSEDGSCLNLYDITGSTVTYTIYNEDEEEVGCGTICFIGQPQASISLQSLEPGIYYLDIVQNGVTFEGEFGIEE
jgi:hypothetical protein